MSNPTIGIGITSVQEELRPAITSSMSVVGMVGYGSSADPIAFPLNTPVLINSNDTAMLAKFGAGSTFVPAILAINNQLGSTQSAAAIVVVRVPWVNDSNLNRAAIQGNQAARTGVWALLNAPELLGVTPRLIHVSQLTASTTPSATALVNSLHPVLEKLQAVAVVDGPADTYANYILWRDQISSKRVIANSVFIREMVDGVEVTASSAACVIGLAVKTDHAYGGVPTRSWGNQVIQGIVGTSRPIAFSLTDGDNEGQQLLAANAGIIVRGSVGVENAMSSGGYTYLGTDNLGDDDVWRFYNQVRMRDYIELTILRTLRHYLLQSNVTAQTITNIKFSIENFLSSLKAPGYILGFKVEIPASFNTTDALRLGKITYDLKAEEAAPLRFIGVRSARYRPAVETLMGDFISQMSQPTT